MLRLPCITQTIKFGSMYDFNNNLVKKFGMRKVCVVCGSHGGQISFLHVVGIVFVAKFKLF